MTFKIIYINRKTNRNNMKICPPNLKRKPNIIVRLKMCVSDHVSLDDFIFCRGCHINEIHCPEIFAN